MGSRALRFGSEVTGADEGARALENNHRSLTRTDPATMAASRALQQQERRVKAGGQRVRLCGANQHRHDHNGPRHGRTRQSRQVPRWGCGPGIEDAGRGQTRRRSQYAGTSWGRLQHRIKGRRPDRPEGRICCRGSGFAGILLKLPAMRCHWVKRKTVCRRRQTDGNSDGSARWNGLRSLTRQPRPSTSSGARRSRRPAGRASGGLLSDIDPGARASRA